MSRTAAIVWDSGQSWAAALGQLCAGRFRVAVSTEYAGICRIASQCPYAVSLWEVNLTNWEDRVRRLREFVRERPSPGVAIAVSDVPPLAVELFREFGALMILEDRLDGVTLLRVLERQRQLEPAAAPTWREMVQTTIPWLD